MTQRTKLNLSSGIQDAVVQMAEGNPGALSVLMKLLQDGPMGFMNLLHLDDMVMRGSQIWVAYKDHCGSDLEELKQALLNRDPAMVATVNASQGHRPGTPKAVAYGATAST